MSSLHPTSQLCSYRNKTCHDVRATKRNGKLHSLCAFHRMKANANQRKLETKKRALSTSDEDQHEQTPSKRKPGCKELWLNPISMANDGKDDHCGNESYTLWVEPIRVFEA